MESAGSIGVEETAEVEAGKELEAATLMVACAVEEAETEAEAEEAVAEGS